MIAPLASLERTIAQVDAGRRPGGWAAPLALSVLAIVYANGLAWLSGPRQVEPSALLATGNLATVPLLLVATALAYRGRWQALGFEAQRVAWSLAVGSFVGVAMALPAAAIFALPPLLGEPLRWDVAAAMSPRDVVLRLTLHLMIGTALFEELLFRGVMWDLFRRAASTKVAWLATSLIFAAWHVVLTTQSVGQTNIPPSLALVAIALGLLGVVGGGLVFGGLRLWAGLPAAIAAHWMVDALMLGVLVARG